MKSHSSTRTNFWGNQNQIFLIFQFSFTLHPFPQQYIYPTAWSIIQMRIQHLLAKEGVFQCCGKGFDVYVAVMHFAACLSGDYRSNLRPPPPYQQPT